MREPPWIIHGGSAFGVGLFLICAAKQIVNADIVEICKNMKYIDRDIQPVQLIVGICSLMNLQQFCEIFLLEIIIFPQIAQSILIHKITHNNYAVREITLLLFKGISLKMYFNGERGRCIMNAETQKKYLEVLEKALEDEQYQQLYREYSECISRLESMLKQLSEEQAEVVCDYIGVCGLMHARILEIACQN